MACSARYRRDDMAALLVQPAPGERISGGYLYNAQMAAHGAWQLLDVRADTLATALESVTSELVIADSIWLSEPLIAPFLRLSARGTRVAVMMHSFPSMIAAAEQGQAIQARPSVFELATLERLGIMLVPGPHYATMLADRALRIGLLPPGIEDGFRRAPRARSGRCELVSIGAVTRRKGFLDVADILARRAQHDDYHWTIVGDLTLDAAYAQAVQERVGPLGSVTCVGPRSRSETSALLARADVLLMPSYDENHPLVLLEALAASVPSIAYAAGAAREMLGHGKAGLVADIADHGAFARHLELLLSDEPRRLALAHGARELSLALPDWPSAGAHARAILAELGSR
jgi:hypothetical protein